MLSRHGRKSLVLIYSVVQVFYKAGCPAVNRPRLRGSNAEHPKLYERAGPFPGLGTRGGAEPGREPALCLALWGTMAYSGPFLSSPGNPALGSSILPTA